MRDRTSHDGAAAAAAGLALALVAVVALCSSATPWRSGSSATQAPERALESIGAIGAIALVAGAVVLWVGTPPLHRRKRRRRIAQASDFEALGAGLSSAVRTAALLLLVVGLFALVALPLASRPERAARPEPTVDRGAAVGRDDGAGRPAGSVDLGWLLLPLGASLALLIPVALVVRRRRFARGRSSVEPEPLGRVARAGIAELESVRDPRRAVLRAYARMEEALAELEIVRAPDETASELLGRTARRLSASGEDAGWLTGRFEEARFSTHEITERDRERALGSLRRIEHELAGAAG
jgi:uncharacterized protein DUF4129